MNGKMAKRTNSELKELMNGPDFYEELLLLKAQELIAELMHKQGIQKVELANKLNQSKAHVTSLLSSGRNLTLKSLANVCYHLGAEVNLGYKLHNNEFKSEDYNYTSNECAESISAQPSLKNQYLH